MAALGDRAAMVVEEEEEGGAETVEEETLAAVAFFVVLPIAGGAALATGPTRTEPHRIVISIFITAAVHLYVYTRALCVEMGVLREGMGLVLSRCFVRWWVHSCWTQPPRHVYGKSCGWIFALKLMVAWA